MMMPQVKNSHWSAAAARIMKGFRFARRWLM